MMSMFRYNVYFNKLYLNFNRKIHLNSFPKMNTQLSKQAHVFNKLIKGNNKKKRYSFFETSPVPAGGLNIGQHVKQNKETSRRMVVLNSLFMRHISGLLVTENLSQDIEGRGLEITRVAVTPNFSQVNVFWATGKEEHLAALEAALPQVGYKLRHELTQLRVIGVVPRIVFMKDKHYYSALRVDHLLKIADYGDDHVPLPVNSELLDETVVPSSSVKASKEKSDKPEGEDILLAEEIMPAMRQDTFNLDHGKIMEKITKSLQKSRAVHRYQPSLLVHSEGNKVDSDTMVEDMTKAERKSAMAKFILNRKVMEEKRRKLKKSSEVDYDLPNYDYDEIESRDFKTEDYIEDDDIHNQKYTNY